MYNLKRGKKYIYIILIFFGNKFVMGRERCIWLCIVLLYKIEWGAEGVDEAHRQQKTLVWSYVSVLCTVATDNTDMQAVDFRCFVIVRWVEVRQE